MLTVPVPLYHFLFFLKYNNRRSCDHSQTMRHWLRQFMFGGVVASPLTDIKMPGMSGYVQLGFVV
jgi:hypothetical protein